MLGMCIKCAKFNAGRRSMWIHISGRQIFNLGTLNSGIVTCSGRWRSGQRWCRLRSQMSESVGWRCTCSFMSPACWRILWGAILVKKESSHVALMKHSRVAFHCSFHLVMPRTLSTPRLVLATVPFSDHLYYSGSMKTRPKAVRSGFVQNGSFK